MKQHTGLFFLLALLLLFESSCSGLPSQRKPVEFSRKDAPPIQCFEPPPDVIARSNTAYLDLTAKRLGAVLQGTGGVGLDVERIRQELPPAVSIFEVIEFRICTQYGNGVLSKEEYHAFTKQIIPAYKNDPPHGQSAIGFLRPFNESPQPIEVACGPSFTTKRPAAQFVSQWAANIRRLRTERNVHDLQNLIEVQGRIPVGLTGKDVIQEAQFTLSCMAEKGELQIEKLGTSGKYHGEEFENQRIIFGDR
ncbi:MAG: hypothetical protein HOP35_10890 [Nitrospira sp.]|nr:hypothetical protein [Nitrospira sp.]